MKRMFVAPALLLAMSVSSQAETSLVMTRVDGGMQELRNLCLETRTSAKFKFGPIDKSVFEK